jgi:hypothetical protein
MNSSRPIEASERKGNLHLSPEGYFPIEVVTELARVVRRTASCSRVAPLTIPTRQ